MPDNTGNIRYRKEGMDIILFFEFEDGKCITIARLFPNSKPLRVNYPLNTAEGIAHVKASIDRINEELAVVAKHNPVSR